MVARRQIVPGPKPSAQRAKALRILTAYAAGELTDERTELLEMLVARSLEYARSGELALTRLAFAASDLDKGCR